MRNLYALGTMAFIVMVVLAPDATEWNVVIPRIGFILGALLVGYHILRYRFRLRYYIRLHRAFDSDRHRDLRTEAKYRRERMRSLLQTA